MPHQDTGEAWLERGTARQARLKATDGVAEYLLSVGQSPGDWHIDLAAHHCTNFRYDVGIDVGPERGQLHAVIIDHPRFGPRLSTAKTRLLCLTAVRIYARRHAAALALKAAEHAADRSVHIKVTIPESTLEIDT